MAGLFGTDGVRGRANEEPMTAATALKIAMAAGRRFTGDDDRRHLAVIGKDTRISSYMLEHALVAGLVSVGMDVKLTGPMPTPAVAMLVRSMRADLGVMISASHNPYFDNGVKLFGPDGFKLSDEDEAAIANAVLGDAPIELAPVDKLGRVQRLDGADGRYIEFVKTTFPRDLRLDGLKIVVDCANGAAHRVAPTVFRELGAEVIPIAVAPDGFNINRACGATAIGALSTAVVTHGADVGLALDGDADRLIVVDECGVTIDGDQIMGLIAEDWAASGRLKGGAVVATVMSNMGLEKRLESQGLRLLRAKVGDRHVLELMRKTGCNVGGEQSGHIIFTDYATTGDGIMAGLQFLACLRRSDRPASEVGRVFDPWPQILRGVRYAKGAPDPLAQAAVQDAIAAAERRLGDEGRVLVRKSGTEPVVRVMAEGLDEALVVALVDDMCGAIEQATMERATGSGA